MAINTESLTVFVVIHMDISFQIEDVIAYNFQATFLFN